MEWQSFHVPCTHIDAEESGYRISMDQLFYNLDGLLKRDMNDCLSKQLNGFFNKHARIYQFGPSNQRDRVNLRAGQGFRKKDEYKTLQESCFSLFARTSQSASVHKPSNLRFKSTHLRNGISSAPSRNGFSSNRLIRPPNIPSKPPNNTSNERKRRQFKLEGLPSSSEAKAPSDLLPSNGWWRTNGKGTCGSDSETDSEVSSEVENSERFDLETKNDGSIQRYSLDAQDSSKSRQSSISSLGSELSDNESKPQAKESSTPCLPSEIQKESIRGISGELKTSSFFHLTSGPGNESEPKDERYLESRPPHPTPDLDEKNCSESKSLLPLNISPSLFITAEKFDDDLKLDSKELFNNRFYNSTSRVNYSNLATFMQNSARLDQEPISREENFQRSVDKYRKVSCAFPRVRESKNGSKNHRAVPLSLQKRAVQNRPNTAKLPARLRLKHRGSPFTKFTKATEETGPNERILPTTLHKSAETSYSVMSPYMANVVWSVMSDEKVV